MNELLINYVSENLGSVDKSDRYNEITNKLNELKKLTYENDGSKKGKLIMNVTP